MHTHFLFYVAVIIFLSFNLKFLQARPPLRNETDKLALLRFKSGIISDPNGILNSWNDSLPFCLWYGITCGRSHQRAVSMVLGGENLVGSISPFIGNLSFLRILYLANNSFSGQIPPEFGNLRRLQLLSVGNNTIQGEIPINLTYCSQLKQLILTGNNLTGRIPARIDSLSMLLRLRIGRNNLTGQIPPSFGNLSLLNFFHAGRNNLEGNLPDELGRLTRLESFYVPTNKLSGKFPPSIFNISSIKVIATAENQLHGTLSNNIGLALPNLQMFGIGDNLLSGSIPNSLCNASQLELFDVNSNYFAGHVPKCLGNLQNLAWLDLSLNNLGNNSTSDMSFLTSLTNCTNLQKLYFDANLFGGVLPDSVSNLSVQLNLLYMEYNQITGIIPSGLGNLINLIGLGMGYNLLDGIIPFSIGKVQKLQELVLDGNRFSGQIPSSVGNLTQLSHLSISQNRLEGRLPASILNFQNLQFLDISQNNLNGSIPSEVFHLSSLSALLNLSRNSLTGGLPVDVGKLININALDISENSLSGAIPATIATCLSLEYLYLQGNSFQATIPSSLASLKGLRELDLSRNNLSGAIPDDLQKLQFLSYLNLSYNDLSGEIPSSGVFRNASSVSLMGNHKLCGGVPQLHQPKCPAKVMKQGRSTAFKLAVTIPCVMFCVLFVLAAILGYRRRESNMKLSIVAKEMDCPVKVSYRDLYHATGGFSADNLIGSGSFGSVYKAFLDQLERYVAVKVLKLETTGASKSFMAECKVLRTVRHRNLVKLLTYCSSIDYKHKEFKALVFEFMEKGSLEKQLCDESRNLNFLERLNIAIDVASALHYLHDLCENPIVHCDLKPSNILLDDEMVAHLSDFGLARLFFTTNDASQSQTSSTGIRGTIGYAPPEYGMGVEASKEGDVYSYGILVLEMFTGKRPTDEKFEGHLNLHNFVKNALPSRLVEIIDPTLFSSRMEEKAATISEGDAGDNGKSNQTKLYRVRGNEEECLVSVLRIGVACSAELPHERMCMKDVAKELHLIKSIFLGGGIYG